MFRKFIRWLNKVFNNGKSYDEFEEEEICETRPLTEEELREVEELSQESYSHSKSNWEDVG